MANSKLTVDVRILDYKEAKELFKLAENRIKELEKENARLRLKLKEAK